MLRRATDLCFSTDCWIEPVAARLNHDPTPRAHIASMVETPHSPTG